jgi:hypothetical protein
MENSGGLCRFDHTHAPFRFREHGPAARPSVCAGAADSASLALQPEQIAISSPGELAQVFEERLGGSTQA